VIHFLNKPLPRSVPARTSRAMLDIEDDTLIPVIRNPQRATEDSEAVFYFPGCGSERLFSQVGIATQAMLWHAGATTVLPPGYLCCGYPQTSSGDEDKGQAITTANRVLFHRVANTLNYLDIKTVVVSCGTCMDQLLKYEFGKIFPGCRLVDIHEWLYEKGIRLDGVKRHAVHVPRALPHADEAPLRHQGGECVDGSARRPQRSLLRRIRHPGGDPARCLDPGALPQAAGDRGAQRLRECGESALATRR
jgi:Fe-S oxidoreductase